MKISILMKKEQQPLWQNKLSKESILIMNKMEQYIVIIIQSLILEKYKIAKILLMLIKVFLGYKSLTKLLS